MSVIYSSVVNELATNGKHRTISIGGRTEKRLVALPMRQAKQQVFLPTTRLLNAENVNTNMFSTTSKQTITIRRGDIDSVKHLVAKITINVVGAPVVLAALPLWFAQIDLRSSSDNALISTAYGDSTMANLLTMVTAGKTKGLFKTLNIDSTQFGYLGTTNALAPGQYIFFLPLFQNSVIGNFSGIHLADATSDLNFDFTPNNPIVSGSGTINLQNFQFEVEATKLADADIAIYRNRYKTYSTECIFLDPIITPFTSKPLTAGAINYFNLLPVTGLCSHQMIVIRQSGAGNNNTNNASFNWLNVGDNEGAAIDLVDANQTSLLGAGNPISTKFLRSHQSADVSDNSFIPTKPCYYVSYCDDIRHSLQGVIKGGFMFESSNVQLALTLPAAPVQEVQTVSFSAAPSASGFCHFSFRGEISADIPSTATPAVIASTLQSMKTFQAQFITVTASASLTAGTSITLTFTHPATSGLEGDLVRVVGDNLGSAALTTRTVAGTAGLTSGQYDVLVYSYLYKDGSYLAGRLRSDLHMCS